MAAATKKCKGCGHSFFSVRKKKLSKAEFNWKELKRGDRIRIYGGDYCIIDDIFIDMSHSGTFTVTGIDDQGLLLSGKMGFCYQNMVRDGKSPSGIVRVIPRIIKI